jgi:hypothetical protein
VGKKGLENMQIPQSLNNPSGPVFFFGANFRNLATQKKRGGEYNKGIFEI